MGFACLQDVDHAVLQKTIKKVMEIAANSLAVRFSGLWLYEADRHTLVSYDVFDRRSHRHSFGQEIKRADSFPFFEALESASLYRVDKVEDDFGLSAIRRRHLDPYEITSLLAVPVHMEHQVAGYFYAFSDVERVWNSQETQFAQYLGEVLSLAIDQQRCRAAERLLLRDRQMAHIALEAIGDAVLTTDVHGRVDYANQAALSWLESDLQQVTGQLLNTILPLYDETTRQAITDPVHASVRSGQTEHTDGYTIMRHPRTQREYYIDLTVSPLWDAEETVIGTVVLLRDVTEQRGLERRISYQATHDALTGLINRAEFERRLSRALEGAREEGQVHAMCYMDLDKFKLVNDTCGHLAGDELLRQLSSQLQEHIRDSDTQARLGGDEFGVLLQGCPLSQAEAIAYELQQLIRNFTFAWKDHVFQVGVSMGLVAINESSGTLADVLSAADAACYMAKEKGRDAIEIYDEHAPPTQNHNQTQWVQRIKTALEKDQFELYFQTIVSLKNDSQAHHCGEFLLRMRDEQGQLMAPKSFLYAAERYHLMPDIDRWVVNRVLRALESNLPVLENMERFSINLSGQSISEDHFLEFLEQVLTRARLPDGMLCFELNETALIANLARASHFFDRLRKLGCRFALDDFGSGLSTFAYLKTLPVDYLKIDGRFVRYMTDDSMDYAMVDSINQIGHVMGIETIAEFAENDNTVRALRKVGVDYAQGFGVSLPRALEPTGTEN